MPDPSWFSAPLPPVRAAQPVPWSSAEQLLPQWGDRGNRAGRVAVEGHPHFPFKLLSAKEPARLRMSPRPAAHGGLTLQSPQLPVVLQRCLSAGKGFLRRQRGKVLQHLWCQALHGQRSEHCGYCVTPAALLKIIQLIKRGNCFRQTFLMSHQVSTPFAAMLLLGGAVVTIQQP